MKSRVAVIPDDAHLDRYLFYPRRAHPVIKECLVGIMERGIAVHFDHELPSMCAFRRADVDVGDASAWVSDPTGPGGYSAGSGSGTGMGGVAPS